MKNVLFNNSITKGSLLGMNTRLTAEQESEILAGLFEQLLLFDKIVLSTDKNNLTLVFLISKLGLETVERLIRSGYILFSIKSAAIFTGTGRQREDGTIDESVIYTQPPIVGGSLNGDDIDPSINIYRALVRFGLSKKERNRLIKNIVPKYIVNDGLEISSNAAKVVTDAYVNNNLENLGLPFEKDPFDLNLEERKILFDLGHTVLDTSILAKNGYKSYNNYEHLEISKKNLENIGKAYKISENVSEILKIENTPDLKAVFYQGGFDISDIFKLRHLSSAKYFRKWINEVGENSDSSEITEAYINEVAGAKKFFETTKGKLIKNTFLFGAMSGLGTLIAGPIGGAVGAAAKPVVEPAVDYGLGLLEEFVLDGIIEGKNPKSYIDKLKKEVNKNAT
ncbi:hypothetical protein [Polaribacter sp. M15]